MSHQVYFSVLLHDAGVVLRVIAVPAVPLSVVVQIQGDLAVLVRRYARPSELGPHLPGPLGEGKEEGGGVIFASQTDQILKLGGQMAERLGSRVINQKVAGSSKIMVLRRRGPGRAHLQTVSLSLSLMHW